MTQRPLLIASGLNDSGSGHWQTWLERQTPRARRVQQWDWAKPELFAWSERIQAEVDACAQPSSRTRSACWRR